MGAGITKFGTHADVTLAELFAEAALPAFDDAGVGPGEVDTLYFGNISAAISENDTHLGPKAVSQILLVGVPTQRFGDAVAAVVDDIAGGPPVGLRAAKRVFDSGADASLATGLLLESQAFGLLLTTDDVAEGVAAFQDDREPEFEGR